jgi:hypothetical protein
MNTYFYLNNLTAHACHSREDGPWNFPAYGIPDEVRGVGGKKLRHVWASNMEARLCVYSGNEAVNPNARISDKDDSNPIHRTHAFAIDFDAKLEPVQAEAGCADLLYKPRAREITLSNYHRLWFQAEQPLPMQHTRLYAAFMALFVEQCGLKKFAGGLDMGAVTNPTRYFTNGLAWVQYSEANVVPLADCQGMLMKAAMGLRWSDIGDTDEIPLNIVAQELAKKYPAFSQWPGEFTLNAQGPTFWVPESRSPMSAIVKEGGIYTFSENATHSFWPWSELLSREFVQQFVTVQLGEIASQFYFNDVDYFTVSPPGSGTWVKESQQNVESRLKVEKQVSMRKDKATQLSTLDRAMQHIRSYNRIGACGPFLFLKPGPIMLEGTKIINTCQTVPLSPSVEEGIYGPDGNFAFVSSFFTGFMEKGIPFDVLMAWIKHFYSNSLAFRQSAGQVLVIAGEVNIGKTFFSNVLMSRLMGGSFNAEKMFFEDEDFTGYALTRPMWCVDDCTRILKSFSNNREKDEFTARLKNFVSVGNWKFNEKYQKACSVTSFPRAILTINPDPESIQTMPAMDQNNRDKVILLKARGKEFTTKLFASTHEENQAMLEKELPFFANWLLRTEFPNAVPDTRFGMVSWHDPELLQISEANSNEEDLRALLEKWAEEVGAARKSKPGEVLFEGAAILLLKELNLDPTLRPFLPKTARILGIQLGKLEHRKIPGITSHMGHGNRKAWRLFFVEKT